MEGRLLFVAKLLGLHDDKAELHQYSESDKFQEGESIHVRIRGYSDHDRKAVYMEGRISPMPHHIWQVEELTVAQSATTGPSSVWTPTWTPPSPPSAA